VSCRKCGYALYRSSARSTARTIYYYRCLGSDAWRHLGGSLCDTRPVRQDLLDELVWREIIKLLENPSLVQAELDRRLAAARNANPTKRREEILRRELERVHKSMDRLTTAYQEDLLSLDELRRRMPELRKREQTSHAELDLMVTQLVDRDVYLRLAETITSFLTRLHEAAKTLDVEERQRIVRLLVKEILVGDDTIVIRHSIPTANGPSSGGGTPSSSGRRLPAEGKSYLLRKGSKEAALDETRRIAELGLRLEGDLHPADLGFGVNQPPSQEARARRHGESIEDGWRHVSFGRFPCPRAPDSGCQERGGGAPISYSPGERPTPLELATSHRRPDRSQRDCQLHVFASVVVVGRRIDAPVR
jgi:Recombinase zinc beta ribbon domain